MQPDAPRLYPVFLKLAGLPVVVVGGGTVAASKLAGLVEAGARVTVIAPSISDAIRTWGAGKPVAVPVTLPVTLPITLIDRGFVPQDLDGARWVVAAATPEVNREVAAAAATRGLFVNAVDDVSSASAYLGAVIRRGPVELAISTGGLAPALAGLVREALEAVLPDELGRWIDVATAARADWKRAGTPIALRRPLLLRALDRIYRAHGRAHGHAHDGAGTATADRVHDGAGTATADRVHDGAGTATADRVHDGAGTATADRVHDGAGTATADRVHDGAGTATANRVHDAAATGALA